MDSSFEARIFVGMFLGTVPSSFDSVGISDGNEDDTMKVEEDVE